MLKVMKSADLHALDADRWFGSVPVNRRRMLLERARETTAQSGARFYAAGDPPDGLWAVLQGEVRLISHPAVGVESVALILRRGTWFGELSTLDRGPRPHDAIAYGSARVLHVPLAAFDQLASEEPQFHRDIGLLVCAHQRSSLAYMAQSIASPVGVRLARTLTSTARASGDSTVRLRQEDIAGMLGVSRQTINKELRRLERSGLVALGYGRILVMDVAGLRALGHDRLH